MKNNNSIEISQMIKSAFVPSADWGPKNSKELASWREFKEMRRKIREKRQCSKFKQFVYVILCWEDKLWLRSLFYRDLFTFVRESFSILNLAVLEIIHICVVFLAITNLRKIARLKNYCIKGKRIDEFWVFHTYRFSYGPISIIGYLIFFIYIFLSAF